MLNHSQKKKSVLAISETLAVIHDDAALTEDELDLMSDKQLDSIIADFSEAIRGMNKSEIAILNRNLDQIAGLTLPEVLRSSKTFIAKILKRKRWSPDDLALLEAVYEQLSPEDQQRVRHSVPL